MGNGDVLVVFGKKLPPFSGRPSVLVAEPALEKTAREWGARFVNLEELVEPGSLYEAGEMLERISQLPTRCGMPVSKAVLYRGYELWWTHYSDLFYYYCLPYTAYRKLLEFLKNFQTVHAYGLPFSNLFIYFLKAHGRRIHIISDPTRFPFSLGMALQILITLLALPILMVRRPSAMVFAGDKFAQGKDHDFRMLFIYESLRARKLPFVEFIRSLEPWRKVLSNALVRRRAVIYPQAALATGRFLRRFSRQYRIPILDTDTQARFEYSIATAYTQAIAEDIWAIRIMRVILHLIGTKAAFITAASERNYPTTLACKLNGIPTVGIMHGVASRYSTPYDFLPGFSGAQVFSVDRYGVWSEWWRQVYRTQSRAYRREQLLVSGPMRPLDRPPESPIGQRTQGGRTRVLLIAEQSAAPEEIMPYLYALLESEALELTIKFRPYRDGFEDWLKVRAPEVLKEPRLSIVKGTMQEAIISADVVVGSHSTGVLEALLQFKTPFFIRTKKWGDYYRFSESEGTGELFAERPEELVRKVLAARRVSKEILLELQERYFGDPTQNGSAWVVDQLLQFLGKDIVTP